MDDSASVFLNTTELQISMPAFTNPLCASTDPEIFFPVSAQEIKDGEKPAQSTIKRDHESRVVKPIDVARNLCKQCDHMSPCRDFAVINRIEFGIWGATTKMERRLLYKLMGLGNG